MARVAGFLGGRPTFLLTPTVEVGSFIPAIARIL